jgi:hypothetical protein
MGIENAWDLHAHSLASLFLSPGVVEGGQGVPDQVPETFKTVRRLVRLDREETPLRDTLPHPARSREHIRQT